MGRTNRARMESSCAPNSADLIERGIKEVLNSCRGLDAQPYGDGRSSEKIVKVLKEYLYQHFYEGKR